MTPRQLAAIAVATIAAAALSLFAAADPGRKTWTFDSDRVDAPPSHFALARTGGGAPGRWVVRHEAGAPSGGNVLAQVDADDTSSRFPLAVAIEPSLQDLRLSVKCKAVSGKIDRACGLVFRYRDENNYYVARANALEDNVRLYRVVDGERRQFAGERLVVAPKVWHELRLDARGSTFSVWLDGKLLFTAEDSTFQEPGKVGLWTKSDSVTWFDGLRFAELAP